MNQLNGWQRTWVVLTALWQLPVLGLFALWVSEGSLSIYAPPAMDAWEMPCSLDAVAGAVRTRYPQDYGDLSNEELKTKISKKYFNDAQSELKIVFWLPKGVDGTKITNLSCADISVAVKPGTKQEQLAVLASLDSYYPTWHKGHDLGSALDTVTKEKIEQSKRERRNGLLLTAGAALIPPGALYAFGAAIGWIRRGFRK